MFKRLFSASEVDRNFEECCLNDKHTLMDVKKITDIVQRYFTEYQCLQRNVNININFHESSSNEINISIASHQKKPTKKEEFIKQLLKKMHQENQVVKIKALIVAHAVIKKTADPEFLSAVTSELDSCRGNNPEEKESKKGGTIEIKL